MDLEVSNARRQIMWSDCGSLNIYVSTVGMSRIVDFMGELIWTAGTAVALVL